MKQKTTAIFTVMLLLGLLLAACQPVAPTEIPGLELTVQGAVNATQTAAPTATPTPTATNTPLPTLTPTPSRVQYGPTEFPENVNPLTGLDGQRSSHPQPPSGDGESLQFPPIRTPPRRLSYADIVFDYYTGEGANRFLLSSTGRIPQGRSRPFRSPD